MSDVSKTSPELIAEAQQHYSEMNGLNSRAAEVMMELVAALEAKTGVRVDMSSAVGVETQLAATRVPVQGERELAAEALRDEFRSYLGDEIYVSSRDHSAWEHGTMGLDDFSLAAEDDEIIESLVQIASRATAPDAATAAIERVRAIHVRDEYGLCAECSWEYPETSYDALSNDVAWPCPTIAALDGAPEPEVKP